MTDLNENIIFENNISWDEALENETWLTPTIDIYETENNFTLIAKMPGVDKENLKVTLEEGHLVIMGRIDFNNLINKKYVMNESEIGNYFRKFKLSNDIDNSKIDAKLVNGQLIVSLTKSEK